MYVSMYVCIHIYLSITYIMCVYGSVFYLKAYTD